MTKLISIIIPAHNEEARIAKTLLSYTRFFDQIFDQSYEIIVILNGCQDNTLDVVAELSWANPHITFQNISKPIGKGGAIIEGFKVAQGNYLGFVDADNSITPEQFFKIFQTILHSPHVDCAIASRNLPSSVVIGKNLPRQVLSQGYNRIVNSLFGFGIRDTQCGAKIISREVYNQVRDSLYIANMAFDVNLLDSINRVGFCIQEVPVRWVDDTSSTIKNPLKVSTQMLLSTINIKLSS